MVVLSLKKLAFSALDTEQLQLYRQYRPHGFISDNLSESELVAFSKQLVFRKGRDKVFNLLQPYSHHLRLPTTGIYVYSFKLSPQTSQMQHT